MPNIAKAAAILGAGKSQLSSSSSSRLAVLDAPNVSSFEGNVLSDLSTSLIKSSGSIIATKM